MSLFFTTQETISQLTEVLSNISQENYIKPIETLSSATIRQHTRHVTEFYQCLLKSTASGIVDYDKRVRDMTLEENKEFAVLVLNSLSSQLRKVNTKNKLVMAFYSSKEDNSCDFINTSFERELAYNTEHMIHHLALKSIGIKILMPGYVLPENFGIAASTIKYRRKNVQSKLSA